MAGRQVSLYYFIQGVKVGRFVTTMDIGELTYAVYGKQEDGHRRFMVSSESGYATKAVEERHAQDTGEIMLVLYDLERKLLEQLNEHGDNL